VLKDFLLSAGNISKPIVNMHIFDACSSMMNFQAFIFVSQDKQYILKHNGISNSFLDIEKPGRASNEEY